MQRILIVRARDGDAATVTVTVYRKTVWLSLESSFHAEAVLDPGKVDSLVSTLAQAAQEARNHNP